MRVICKARRQYILVPRCRPYNLWTKRYLGTIIFLLTCISIIMFYGRVKEYTFYIDIDRHTLKMENELFCEDSVILGHAGIYSENKIKNNTPFIQDNMPLLTLFTSWVDRKDKYVVQNRTIENWITFKPYVHPIIFTNDTKLGNQCLSKGWYVLPLVHTAAGGVPVLRYMYLDAMRRFSTVFYGFANSDILFNDGLMKTLRTVRHFLKLNQVSVLITGRRTNVDYKLPCNASDWRNITNVSKKGELVEPVSADYFITTKNYPWEKMDEIIIGRMRVDNWVIQFSQIENILVIDSTMTILAMHQTTETGNAEGESKDNKYYNDIIVSKVRAFPINVKKGRTDCANYITTFSSSELVQLVKQSTQSTSTASTAIVDVIFNFCLSANLFCFLY